MPSINGIEISEQQLEKFQDKDISEDEVGDCISEKMDEGMDQDQAIAACLNMLETGSTEPSQVDSLNPEEIEEQTQLLNENRETLQRKSFTVTGKNVEVKENSDGDTVVNVPIQSLSEDRDGDIINEKGQESIIRQLKSGKVPLVPNHGIGAGEAMYDFRDIFGQFVDGDNRSGTTIGTARLLPGNQHSEKLVELLENDMPVGFSVGFIPQEKEPRGDKKDDGFEISDLDLMEVSAVGIPSNPDAVPQAMSSAVAMAKNAGLTENQIKDSIKRAFEDTMSNKSKEKDSTDPKNENQGQEKEQEDGSKESQDSKQLSEDVANEILSAANEAAESMLQDLEEQLDNMVNNDSEDSEEDQAEDDDNEDEAEDEDEDEQENVEQSGSEPGEKSDASDHTEDSEKSSSESVDQSSEKDSLSDDEKTVDNNQSSGRKMNTLEDEDSEEKQEGEGKDPENDPSRAEQPADYWA